MRWLRWPRFHCLAADQDILLDSVKPLTPSEDHRDDPICCNARASTPRSLTPRSLVRINCPPEPEHHHPSSQLMLRSPITEELTPAQLSITQSAKQLRSVDKAVITPLIDDLLVGFEGEALWSILSSEEREEKALDVLTTFLLQMHRGQALKQLSSMLDALEFWCSISTSLEIFSIKQTDGGILEFPLEHFVHATIQTRTPERKMELRRAQEALRVELWPEQIEDGDSSESPMCSEGEDYIVLLDFTGRRLAFVFESSEDALYFKAAMQLTALLTNGARAGGWTCLARKEERLALRPAVASPRLRSKKEVSRRINEMLTSRLPKDGNIPPELSNELLRIVRHRQFS